jgi:hypothetical protein
LPARRPAEEVFSQLQRDSFRKRQSLYRSNTMRTARTTNRGSLIEIQNNGNRKKDKKDSFVNLV